MVGVVCGETDPAVSHGKSSCVCHEGKYALGIKKLEKFLASRMVKTSKMVDLESYSEEERCYRNLRRSNRFLKILCRLTTIYLCVGVPYLLEVEPKIFKILKIF